MKTADDNELLLLLKDGCHEAYAEIYRRHYAVLFSHAYKRLGDRELAKDIIQELFTNIWEKREVFVIKSSLSGYFFTTINNRIVNHFLHQGVREKYASAFASFALNESAKSDHRIREKQLAQLIEQEIQSLPPKMRRIFEMSRKEHLSHKEIAERLELNEKTVDRQVSNALLRLKAKFLLSLIIYFLFESP